ncbi:unnamed protein product [Hydatigera taeniaeformis]|uniref:FACT complex subunit SSRP1 n=1 Tax=Hydatigena taeniaeformis TaxID=6205 RepID=A0A0R3WU19_HYDTA|nr:unnamed protein product [Hydatigera taeniaeformis]
MLAIWFKGEDSKVVLTARKTDFLFPVDLPFLNLSQCTQATLDNPSALLSLMLGSTNGFATRTNPEKVSKGIHTLFGKSKTQSSDGNVLQTPFIAGIGYKPVKVRSPVFIHIHSCLPPPTTLRERFELRFGVRVGSTPVDALLLPH